MKDDRPFCFIDFDGTINDCRMRLYHFYISNVPVEYSSILSIDEYWNLKRMGIDEVKWTNEKLNISINAKAWSKKKRNQIESMDYLKYDKLYPFSRNALLELDKRYKLILVTKRSSPQNLIKQLTDYGVLGCFYDLLIVSDQTKQDAVKCKYTVTPECIFVGDTEDDIEAGLMLGCKPFFVLSGIRDLWVAQKYSDKRIVVIESIATLI